MDAGNHRRPYVSCRCQSWCQGWSSRISARHCVDLACCFDMTCGVFRPLKTQTKKPTDTQNSKKRSRGVLKIDSWDSRGLRSLDDYLRTWSCLLNPAVSMKYTETIVTARNTLGIPAVIVGVTSAFLETVYVREHLRHWNKSVKDVTTVPNQSWTYPQDNFVRPRHLRLGTIQCSY